MSIDELIKENLFLKDENNKIKTELENIKESEWNERLKCLKSHIEYWCDPINITDKTIEIIQLYYNQ